MSNKEELVIRTIAMPADTNFNGDIFGGWLVSQMDLGGAVAARKAVNGRIVTVAIDSMKFIKPVNVGDTVCIYAEKVKEGTTSVAFNISAYVTRQGIHCHEKVTEARFTYVHINEKGKATPIQKS